ncbi:MAG: serine hydrolase [Caldilinea sp.]
MRATTTWLCLILFLLALLPSTVVAQSSQPIDPVDLETFIDGMMAAHLEGNHIPGATLAVVHNGEALLLKGYGYADLATRTPVEPERTLFRPGSTSKLITWTAVMQQVEQGRLDLHADVNNYLDFAIPATFVQPITLAHLLAHTPGFEDIGEGLFVLSADELFSLEEYVKRHLPARILPPGQVSAYSNYGTALAGYIVQRVSGEPFEEYVERHIFAPLDMAHSTFHQPLPTELASDMASGYNYTGGVYRKGSFEYIPATPAGAMSTSAGDMARFMLAHLQDGRLGDARILEEATAQMMHSQLFTPDLRFDGMAHGFMTMRVNGRRVLHHGGDTPLFHTALYLAPEENVGLFVSYNALGGALVRDALFRAFMDRYFPAPLASVTPSADALQRAAQFVGEYHAVRANQSSMEKVLQLLQPLQVQATEDGGLLVATGVANETYVEVEPGLFRHSTREDRVLFQTDADGRTWMHLSDMTPLTSFRAPWYATLSVAATLVVGGILLFLLSAFGWLVAFVSCWRQKAPSPRLAVVARWSAALFGALLVAILAMLVGIVGDIHPDYGVPRIFFGAPPALTVLLALPFGLAALALAMMVFAVIAWLKRFWSWFGRLHYSALTVTAMAVVWLLWYWKLLAL